MTYPAEYRRILHRMGYYSYQEGLIRRHLDQAEGWIEHEKRCRSFILDALAEVNPEIVTVLGSGWLMDLPLAEIAEKCRLVRLVDIFHPPGVIRQIAEMNNVEIIEADVSGGLIREVWEKAGKRNVFNRLRTLEGIMVPFYELPADSGMVISLNILTQLEVLPEKLLKKKSRAAEVEFAGFRREVQQNHLESISKFPSVLISDASEIIFNKRGDRSEHITMLVSPDEGIKEDEWIWDFDLSGYDSSLRRSVFRVKAFLLKASQR